MNAVPHIEGWAYIPYATLGERSVRGLTAKMTVRPRAFQNTVVEPIHMYNEDKEGYLGLPIDFAINHFQDMMFEDRTVQGGTCYYNRLPDPTHPNAAEGQAEFMRLYDEAAQNYWTFIAKAKTGAGKTAVSLRNAAIRGRRTLIIVQTEKLGWQWADAIEQHLGVPKSDIGWVQGDKCGWEHPFVIAIAHSVAGRIYPADFYNAFGTIIYDEVHRVGAHLFAKTVGLFPANLKVGLTATDRRKDKAENVFFYYFGRPKVIATSKIRDCRVNVLDYNPVDRPQGVLIPRYMETSGQLIGELVKDRSRNKLCTDIICKLYDMGRQILVIGDRVEHLQHLMDCGTEAGIPRNEMGLFVNAYYTDEQMDDYPKLKFRPAPTKLYTYWCPRPAQFGPPFKHKEQLSVVRHVGGNSWQMEGALTGKIGTLTVDEMRMAPVKVRKTVKTTEAELKRIKAESILVYATYGMFKEGQDIPKLDAGIDVTPRSDGEQVIGRTRRPFEGAPDAVWYTIADRGHPVLERWTKARIRDYETAGAQVIRHGQRTGSP